MAVDIGSAVAYLRLDSGDFDYNLTQAHSALSNFATQSRTLSGQIEAAGSAMSHIGASLTQKLTVPLVNFGKSAIDAFRSYESAFAGVKKTIDEADVSNIGGYEVLSEAIQKMATETASSAEEIAAVMEMAGQLGVPLGKAGEDIIKFTKTMVMLGDSTNLTAEEAALNLAKFMNITGTAAADSDRLGAAIVDLGNKFATQEDQIVNMSTRLASAGRMAGLTEQEILALATAMSSVGIRAEAGGSAMATTLTTIEKIMNGISTKYGVDAALQLETLAKTAKMTSIEFKEAWEKDPITAISRFVKGLGEMEEEGESAVVVLDTLGMSGVRQSNMLKALALSADNMDRALNVANTSWDKNTALVTEANKRYETLDSRMSQLQESFNIVKREIAELLLPVFEKLVQKVRELIDWWNGLDSSTKKLIISIAEIAVVIGPLLTVMGKITMVVGGVVGIFEHFTGVNNTLADSLGRGTTHTNAAAASFGTLAGEALKLAALAVVILSVAKAIQMLVDAAIQLYNAGSGAVMTFALITASAVALAAGIAAVGSACTATAPGLLALGAAVLMVSGGIALIVVAISQLVESFGELIKSVAEASDKLPIIAEYGGRAALAIAEIGVAALAATVPLVAMDVALAAFNITAALAAPIMTALSLAVTAMSVAITALSLSIDRLNISVKAFGEVFSSTWSLISKTVSKMVDDILGFVEKLVFGIIDLFKRLKYELVGDPIVLDIVDEVSKAFWEMVKKVVEFIGDLVIKIIDFFRDILSKTIEFCKNMIDKVVDFFKNLWSSLKQWFATIVSTIQEFVQNVITKITNFFQNIKDKLSNFVSNVKEKIASFISNLVSTIVSFISNVVSKIADFFSNLWNKVKKFVDDILSSMKDFFKNIVSNIVDLIQNMISKVTEFFGRFKDLGRNLFESFGDGVRWALDSITSWIQNKLSWIVQMMANAWNSIRSMASSIGGVIGGMFNGSHANGLDFVPFDGYVAQLHKGERVLTKQEAREYNEGKGNGARFGDINIYSYEKLDEYEASRQMQRAVRNVELGFY